MRLPNAQQAILEPRKLQDYVLSLEHPVGRFKALFFAIIGFKKENWQDLRSELMRLTLESAAEAAETTEYGSKYVVRGTIEGPTGKTAKVLSVWIVLVGEENPRFVTVYPEH